MKSVVQYAVRTPPAEPATWSLVLAAVLGLGRRASPVRFAALLLASIGQGLLPVAGAWLIKVLFDELSAGRAADGRRVAWAAAAIAGLVLLAVFARPIADHAVAVLRRAITVTAQDRLFASVNRFAGLRHFEDPALRDQLQLAQDAARCAPQQVIDSALRIVPAVLLTAGYGVSIALIWPPMLGILAAAAVPVLLVEVASHRRRAALTDDLTPSERRQFFYQRLLVDVRAAKEIRLSGTGAFLHARMVTALHTAANAESASDRRTVLAQCGLGLLGGLLAGTALVVAVRGAITGTVSVGDVALFVAAVAGVRAALPSTVAQCALVHGSLALCRVYLDVVNARDDLPQGSVSPPPVRTGIELRDVWFRYGDGQAWILRGVDLFVPAGSAVGLVGVNGAGKSTLVKLLCRFYDPQRGRILWDGVDIREMPVDALRARIAAVFQDFMCYDLTVRENIALGQLSALDDDERISTAARLAEVDDLTDALPHGYDTMLSRIFSGTPSGSGGGDEQGVVVSGGHWQRLALARALVRDAGDLVILDEPSSGLDPQTEHRLQRTLRARRADTATLLISHRLETLRDADHIAVLVDGRIAEYGSHDELVALAGEYSRLFSARPPVCQDAVAGSQTATG